MKAVAVLQFRATPALTELPVPTFGPAEVLVRVEFAGINPFDWKIADGLFEGRRPHVFPLVLGVDAAGVVEAAGPSVTRFRAGDRIFGQFLHDPVGTGTYAELTPVPERIGVSQVPPDIGSDEAAALPTAGMTALASLDALGLPRGATLVIVGASGGVGSFATELASRKGIQVTALARPSSAARLRSMGATDVIDPTNPEAATIVARDHPPGFDGLLDVMSDISGFSRWATVVRRGGCAVSTTYAADIAALRGAGIRGVNVDLQPRSELLERLVKDIVGNHLTIPLERRVPLAEAAGALAELKAGRASGKAVVDVRS